MTLKQLSIVITCLFAISCSGSDQCDQNQAYNKMLALSKVQARLVAKGGESGMAVSARMAIESAPVGELIAQQKYNEACAKAEEIAKRYGMDLANEQKDMITMEQLTKDGGKGSGTCSVADAAKKQMEVHALLQAEVDAGRQSSEIFRRFSEDTVGFGEMLSTIHPKLASFWNC